MQNHTSYKYNGKSSLNQQRSSSPNGTTKIASGNKANGEIIVHSERHHLLNLTDSEINDSAEDLHLPMPPAAASSGGGILAQGKSFKTSAGAITNGVTTAAGRIRRKIRLKRRQRDNRASSSHTLINNKTDANGEINSSTHSEGQASSDSHTGDSDYCYPAATACCLCLPPTSVFSSNYASSRSNQNKYQYNKANQRSHHHHSTRHNQNSSMHPNHHYFHQPVKHSMVIATVFVFFTLAFVGLSYFAFNLQGQISTLSMHLEPVVEERKMISDINHQFRSQLSVLSSNQTHLKKNISTIFDQIETLTSQLQQLNTSVVSLLEALNAAPYLKTLPEEVSDVQKKVAQFGSRLTDLESQLTKSETDLRLDIVDIKKDLADNKIKPRKKDDNNTVSDNQSPAIDMKTSVSPVDMKQFEKVNNKVNMLEETLVTLDKRFQFFGSNLTEQLQQQEKRASNSWKLLGELQDDIQNVSAKAHSNEIKYQKAQARLSTLDNNFLDFSQKVSRRKKRKII